MDLERRYQNLLRRRAPNEDRQVLAFTEQFESEEGLSLRLLVGSLAPVDRKYTAMLKEQGDRVEAQLRDRLPPRHAGVIFRRQGSVSNDTHIRFSSDVDVLALHGAFTMLEHPQAPAVPYTGNVVEDLIQLRSACARHLKESYPAATVDDTGSTAVWLKGGSLKCDVDVVPANWFDTVAYANSRAERDRGVMVYNRERKEHIKNYPFLFNYRIDQQDSVMGGLLRAQIRLLKTIAADLQDSGEGESLSSFDICSLVYRMDASEIIPARLFPSMLARKLLAWLRLVEANEGLRATLKVVDDSRLIFNDDRKLRGVAALRRSLQELAEALPTGLASMLYETRAHLPA